MVELLVNKPLDLAELVIAVPVIGFAVLGATALPPVLD
jgi:hypothetical protein